MLFIAWSCGEHPLPGGAAPAAALAPASLGSVLAAVVFMVATFGLRVYLTWITSTGYTYGALATPIAFLLFAFFLGFAIMMAPSSTPRSRRSGRLRPPTPSG